MYFCPQVSLDNDNSLDLDFGTASGVNEPITESLQYHPDLTMIRQNFLSDSDTELAADLNTNKSIKQEIEDQSEDDMSLPSIENGSPVTITTTPSLALSIPYSETDTPSPSMYSYSNVPNCDTLNLALPLPNIGVRESSGSGARSSFRIGINKTTQPLITSTNEVIENQRSLVELNEFDVFAKNVALQLKQLPLENALQVQAKIHEILITERLNVIRKSKQNASCAENKEAQKNEV